MTRQGCLPSRLWGGRRAPGPLGGLGTWPGDGFSVALCCYLHPRPPPLDGVSESRMCPWSHVYFEKPTESRNLCRNSIARLRFSVAVLPPSGPTRRAVRAAAWPLALTLPGRPPAPRRPGLSPLGPSPPRLPSTLSSHLLFFCLGCHPPPAASSSLSPGAPCGGPAACAPPLAPSETSRPCLS